VKLTKPRMKEEKEKEREIEENKRRTKENIRERWWMIKQQTRQPNL
jgi:hypothetical protein